MAQRYRSPGGTASRERTAIDRVEQSGAHKAAVRPRGIAYPQLRIGRAADISPDNSEMWNEYINEFAAANKHRGATQPLGAIACNMILDTEMRSMIAAKYPDAPKDIKLARDIYANIARNVNRHISRTRQSHEASIRDIDYRERPDLMGMTIEAGHPSPSGNLWTSGFFMLRPSVVTAFGGYDGNKIAIDLSANPELVAERRSIIRYLRVEEKLDAERYARSDWQPHATIFRANAALDVQNAMPEFPAEFPADIALLAPRAHVYNVG